MMDIFQKIVELQNSRTPAALVTVIRTKGAVPREPGSRMIVLESGKIFGTIGGSSVEGLVIQEAIETLRKGVPRVVEHDLFDEEGKDTGMVCGGQMEFFIEPLGRKEKLYIFGGGHVALPLAQMAHQVGFSLTVIDDRAEFASAERFPEAEECVVQAPEPFAAQLSLTGDDYVVIVTRGHKDDYGVLRHLIQKPFRYLGMIGSKVKRNEIYDKLQKQDGIAAELLEKVHCPIGLAIGSETPEEIAISIIAELIQVRRSISSK